jgi:hypothetical protein
VYVFRSLGGWGQETKMIVSTLCYSMPPTFYMGTLQSDPTKSYVGWCNDEDLHFLAAVDPIKFEICYLISLYIPDGLRRSIFQVSKQDTLLPAVKPCNCTSTITFTKYIAFRIFRRTRLQGFVLPLSRSQAAAVPRDCFF